MEERPSLIRSDVDLDADGKHAGFLRVPFSSARSAYGWIPVPIVSVRNRPGPAVLLVSGNHGDEYEGQVALMDLIRRVRPEDVRGQIIILPAANFPAVMAASRLSPIDGGNLNREFPGNPTGTPTQMIAHYITAVLAPRVGFAFDIHAGGTSLFYVPTLLSGPPPADPVERARIRGMIEAIGLPHSLVFRGGGVTGGRNLGSVVKGNGGVSFACEIGGGGGLTPASVAIAKDVLARFLAATGAWRGAPPPPPAAATRFLANGPGDYVYAMDAGVFEPARQPGDTVAAGDPAGLIHFPDTPWREPAEVRFERGGTILCVRPISQCARGDCLFQTGEPWPDAFD